MPPEILVVGRPPIYVMEAIVARYSDVAAGWLLTYIVHSTIILIVAWVIASRPRVSVGVRDVIWKFALLGGIATASVQTAVSREPLGGQLLLAPRTGASAANMRVSIRGDTPGSPTHLTVRQSRGTRWSAGVVIVWLAGGGLGLLWLTVAHARTLRALGERTDLRDTPIGRRLAALLARARVDRHVELTCSDTIASPVALVGDEVCLPRRALLELEPNEQDGMLAHEVAHLVRRDPQWLVAARVIEVVLFMQPLNRLARRRMQDVAEYLCDDWAVSRMSKPVTLAKCLAAVAEWVGRAPRSHVPRLNPMSAMVEQGGSPLVQRVGRILSGASAPRANTGRLTIAVSMCALVTLAAVAPRVAIARGRMSEQAMTFIQAVGEAGPRARPAAAGGVVFTTGRARILVDSLVSRRNQVAAGAIGENGNIVVRQLVMDTTLATLADSSVDVFWARRVPPPVDPR